MYLPRLEPATEGVFLQPDPIGFAGGDALLSRYAFGDPINNIDPSGLKINDLTGGVIPMWVKSTPLYRWLDQRPETIDVRLSRNVGYTKKSGEIVSALGIAIPSNHRTSFDVRIHPVTRGFNSPEYPCFGSFDITVMHELGHVFGEIGRNLGQITELPGEGNLNYDHSTLIPFLMNQNLPAVSPCTSP